MLSSQWLCVGIENRAIHSPRSICPLFRNKKCFPHNLFAVVSSPILPLFMSRNVDLLLLTPACSKTHTYKRTIPLTVSCRHNSNSPCWGEEVLSLFIKFFYYFCFFVKFLFCHEIPTIAAYCCCWIGFLF